MTVLAVLTGLMSGAMRVKEMVVNDVPREETDKAQEEEQGQDS